MSVDGTLLRLTSEEILAAPHEVLASLVQRYQDELDQALEQTQAKDDHAARAEEDCVRLGKDLDTAKRRIDELLNEQARMEDELSGRIEVLDNLRANVRELEREKKEATKRYREQAETHEAERQAWYDQESHLKMRVADLTASPTKRHRSRRSGPVEASEESPTTGDEPVGTGLLSPADADTALDGRDEPLSSSASSTTSADPAPPSATELSLAAQLASLTTAHDSLASSYRTLQTEMSDLKRVYQNLQEENESYEILLGERTLSGEVQNSQIFRSSAAWSNSAPESSLYRLEEGDDEHEGEGGGSRDPAQTRRPTRSPRFGSPRSVNAEGLDLAAELEAVEPVNKQDEEEGHGKRTEQAREKELAHPGKAPELGSVEAELRQEVRTLKDANKALTLYVSKIVDRVCQQEGFEKVLAVDYRQGPAEENTTTPSISAKKPRPASIGFFSRQAVATSEVHKAIEPATPTTTSHSLRTAPSGTPTSNLSSPSPATARKSGGGLLESVTSVFSFSRGSSISPSPGPGPGPSPGGMKPLMLADSARKLDPVDDLEDEDDRRERERIHNEMVQLGFEPPPASRLAAAGANRRAASTSPRLGTSPGELDGPVETHSPVLMSPEEHEQHARNELREGRSSGFTEPPMRRMSIARRRQSLRRSPRPSDSPGDAVVGLGIDEEFAPADYFGPIGKSLSPVPPVSPSDEAPALRKAFRRLSAAFTSPSMGP